MPLLRILSTRPQAGKTTAAVALAQGLSLAGARVSLTRAGDGDAAHQDAATFATYAFASSPGRPVEPAAVTTAAAEIAISEADAATSPADAAAVIVVRAAPDNADRDLGRALGEHLIGTIATCVVPARVEAVARDLTNGGLRPSAIIPEDRDLAAPSVGEIRAALGAEVLYAGEDEAATVADVVIAPVYADPARPHFRRFGASAVLAPFHKTDLQLVAIETQATCLVITGGRPPSPYLLDRAQGEATTVLLAPHDTPQTLAALAPLWPLSRFRGEAKARAAFSYLDGRVDFAALARRLGA